MPQYFAIMFKSGGRAIMLKITYAGIRPSNHYKLLSYYQSPKPHAVIGSGFHVPLSQQVVAITVIISIEGMGTQVA
jgi:hypothetical protein